MNYLHHYPTLTGMTQLQVSLWSVCQNYWRFAPSCPFTMTAYPRVIIQKQKEWCPLRSGKHTHTLKLFVKLSSLLTKPCQVHLASENVSWSLLTPYSVFISILYLISVKWSPKWLWCKHQPCKTTSFPNDHGLTNQMAAYKGPKRWFTMA